MSGELSANTYLSHYRIVSKLGAGGMGEVYLATDTKLDRKVALKTLPAKFAANQDRMRRFVQEAKAAAALNHPNIAHVYQIGESDGVHFIAMEYIDGVTLRDKIHRDREPLQKTLKYLIQVAEGLAKAHLAGIVHRDLKPDNIMITRDDYAKILDFGLAKLVEPQSAFGSGESDSSEIATAILRQQSIPGIVMGTVGYMSPEQASGRVNEIDHRSDIFSFGCLLFEAASGKKPFEGKDALDSLHKVVHMPTPQLKEANPFAPDELQRVVRRCLAKEPDKRYQSMKEVAIEIDDLQHELKTQIGLEYRQPALTTGATLTRASADEGFWVGVLPFKIIGSSIELDALSGGMTEEIITGLSRFSYLRVISQGSTSKYPNESSDIRATAGQLGARYVMGGSIRQVGSTVRLAVQLVDATTGANLWAETFDRQFQPDRIFTLQDELVPRIVSTCADHFGVLARSISDAVRWKDPGQLTPYDALMRGFGYHHRLSPTEHKQAREVLERAVEQAPSNADCWAMLSWIYSHEYGHGFNTQPGSLDRALAAAQRAVDLAPTNHLAYQTLAVALFFRKEFASCLSAAERAMSLNPLDGSNEAIFLITFTGDWERGCALINRAMDLNPHHPGWYRWVLALNEYRKANYREAVDAAIKANAGGIFWTNMLLAAAYGQLGDLGSAREALRTLLTQKPDFVESGRETLVKWFEAELVEHLSEGLRKAGMEADSPVSSSVGLRPDDGFWVAVLPFRYRGANAELESSAEGISEDIVTGLSRFSYLRVIARSSTLRYSSEAGDEPVVGKALGARYVMEGYLRLAGSTLRLAVQLVDASTGAHLWAETYDRTFIPDSHSEFALQDDLVPRIVSTVADWYGVLPHSMSEAVRLKPPGQLTPDESVLRSFGYFERITPEEHGAVRSGLERAVEQAPGNADAWAMLSMMYGEEHRFGFNAEPDPLGRSLRAARRAVDAAHANHFAWLGLAQALFFRKEFDAFRDAAERAMALNPMDGSTLEYLGHLIAFSGDWERGCDIAGRARQLNPNHPGWYWVVHSLDAYRNGDYQTARSYLLKSLLRGGAAQAFTQALLAAVYGQLGEREAAERALREAVALKADFPRTGRAEFEKWYLPELVEQLIDGLRKAGLEIAAEEAVSRKP